MNKTISSSRVLTALSLLAVAAPAVYAQEPSSGSGSGLLIVILVLVVLTIGAVGLWWKKKQDEKSDAEPGNKVGAEGKDGGAAMADESGSKRAGSRKGDDQKRSNYPKGFPQTSKVLSSGVLTGTEFRKVKEKIEKLRFDRLPINRFEGFREPKPFDALPVSNDESVLSAIEQTHDESVEDEEIRGVAVRVLARFKARNSVDALAEVALYDLSANLRAKAVTALAEFDHESVFETVLLACADPTREVRAAGAKALFNLSFSRADAWVRIAECGNQYRVVQSARAALEADFLSRSVDRLVHADEHYAYEAFALVAILIKAEETEELFRQLESHADTNVKLGILRVFGIIRDEKILPALQAFSESDYAAGDVRKAANELLESFEPVMA